MRRVNYWDELHDDYGVEQDPCDESHYISAGEPRPDSITITGFRNTKREKKLSGIYRHRVLDRKVPLVRSMDDYYYWLPIPVIRRCAEEDIRKKSGAGGSG